MNKVYYLIIAVALVILIYTPERVRAEEPRSGAIDNKPVLTLTETNGLIRGQTQSPMLRVYADRTVRVDLPEYRKGAGSYEYRLSEKSWQTMLIKLSGYGLPGFDAEAVRQQRSNRAAATENFATLDNTTTVIEINLPQSNIQGRHQPAVQQTIVWDDIAQDANRFKDIEALRGLARSRMLLLEMTEHERFNARSVQGGRLRD